MNRFWSILLILSSSLLSLSALASDGKFYVSLHSPDQAKLETSKYSIEYEMFENNATSSWTKTDAGKLCFSQTDGGCFHSIGSVFKLAYAPEPPSTEFQLFDWEYGIDFSEPSEGGTVSVRTTQRCRKYDQTSKKWNPDFPCLLSGTIESALGVWAEMTFATAEGKQEKIRARLVKN